MKRGLIAARVALGLCLLALLIWFTDVDKLIQTLHLAKPAWISAALLLIVCATLIGAVSLHMLISLENEINFVDFLPLYWTSWAVGLVLPGQVGDVASLAALLRRHQMAMSTTVGRSLADKLVSLGLMIVFATWAARAHPAFGALLGAIALMAGAAMLLYRHRGRLPQEKTMRVLDFARTAMGQTRALVLRRPGLMVLNLLLTVVKICLTGLAYWCMFRAFGFDQAPALEVIPLVAISSLVAYIPISFNGIGTTETAGIALFSALGVSATGVLASYLTLRALGLAVAWIPAGAWLLLVRPGLKAAP